MRGTVLQDFLLCNRLIYIYTYDDYIIIMNTCKTMHKSEEEVWDGEW